MPKGKCLNTGRTHFKKGHIPWTKSQKGIHLSPATEFKKGCQKTSNWYKAMAKRCGKNHSMWKNGKRVAQGYIYILQPSHPFANKQGYVKRSRLVMEKMIGRYLKPKEQVHHKGIKYPFGSIENKQDDRPKNLQLFASNSAHLSFHGKLRFPKGSLFGKNIK